MSVKIFSWSIQISLQDRENSNIVIRQVTYRFSEKNTKVFTMDTPGEKWIDPDFFFLTKIFMGHIIRLLKIFITFTWQNFFYYYIFTLWSCKICDKKIGVQTYMNKSSIVIHILFLANHPNNWIKTKDCRNLI